MESVLTNRMACLKNWVKNLGVNMDVQLIRRGNEKQRVNKTCFLFIVSSHRWQDLP
jgi:hypothetical protein